MTYRKLLICMIFSAVSVAALAVSPEKPMFDPQFLAQANMQSLWESRFTLNKNEEIANIWDVDGRVYICTSDNYLYCFDADNGQYLFSYPVASPGLPAYKPTVTGDSITMVAANKIIKMDPDFGTILGTYDPGLTVVCPVVQCKDRMFIATGEKTIHALRSKDKLPLYKVSADSDSAVTSLLANNTYVYFATDKGNVIAFVSSSKKKRWQYNAVGAIEAPLVKDKTHIYASSKDSNVYKISILNGKVDWLFRSGGSMNTSARIGKDAIYQFVDYKGLYAIDKKTGKQLWLLPNATDVLTECAGNAYVYTKDKTLAVIENATGKVLRKLNFSPINSYVANGQNCTMFVADDTGKISAIKVNAIK